MTVVAFLTAVLVWRAFGNKVIRPLAEILPKYESDKINFLDTEGDITSSEAVTQKYTEPKQGAVQIGKFRVGIIPLIIVAVLLINKLKK